jgi:tetratricopeptide (TPR) repeat protein
VRRTVLAVLVAACLAGVVGYQVTRPDQTGGSPRVFVPSATFFEDFSPSFKTSIADAYFLYMVQYYGEHIKADGRLDSQGDLVELVTHLSPRFIKAYEFGAFALLDAGEGAKAYEILQRGVQANPGEWRLPALAGFLVYTYGRGDDKDKIAAEWYAKAGAIEGSPAYLDRLAAVITAKGGETEKAALMWGQIYADGDKYSREKAVAALGELLSSDPARRAEELAALRQTMSAERFDKLSWALLGG